MALPLTLAKPCECVRAVPPGWTDPPHGGREAPAGRRYIIPAGVDPRRDWLPRETADAECRSCGGTGLLERAPEDPCGCLSPLPPGWLFGPVPSGAVWPAPPVGRSYVFADPGGPPVLLAEDDCPRCRGTGREASPPAARVTIAELILAPPSGNGDTFSLEEDQSPPAGPPARPGGRPDPMAEAAAVAAVVDAIRFLPRGRALSVLLAARALVPEDPGHARG